MQSTAPESLSQDTTHEREETKQDEVRDAQRSGTMNLTAPLIELGDGKIDRSEILISSWNVNGFAVITAKGEFQKYLSEIKPDIMCIQETKLSLDNYLEKGVKFIPPEYNYYFNCLSSKKGYSGTLIISKYKPISVKYGIGIIKHDLEGRTITAEFEKFYLVTCYVPNSGAKLEGLHYRVSEWDVDFRNYLNELKKKKNVIVAGDFNCAHTEMDIHNPKNTKMAGFTPEERETFNRLIDVGFVDTFRNFYPNEIKYSFFSMRFQSRERNTGWRIDYFLVNKEGLSAVSNSVINDQIFGSDHLPIELTFNPQFD